MCFFSFGTMFGTMRAAALLTLMCGAAAYFAGSNHPQQDRVAVIGENCREKLGHALEKEWMGCVVDGLLDEQEAARKAGRRDYFPVAEHTFEPWSAVRGDQSSSEGLQTSELLKDLLRNFSCDVEDGGSAPLRSMTWEYQTPDPCAKSPDEKGAARDFVHKDGFLPAGNDLQLHSGGAVTQAEAERLCLHSKSCRGFTFHSADVSPNARFTVRASRANAARLAAAIAHTIAVAPARHASRSTLKAKRPM